MTKAYKDTNIIGTDFEWHRDAGNGSVQCPYKTQSLVRLLVTGESEMESVRSYGGIQRVSGVGGVKHSNSTQRSGAAVQFSGFPVEKAK